jgi:hypothetical protein
MEALAGPARRCRSVRANVGGRFAGQSPVHCGDRRGPLSAFVGCAVRMRTGSHVETPIAWAVPTLPSGSSSSSALVCTLRRGRTRNHRSRAPCPPYPARPLRSPRWELRFTAVPRGRRSLCQRIARGVRFAVGCAVRTWTGSDVETPIAWAVPTLPSASSALSAVGASIYRCPAWAALLCQRIARGVRFAVGCAVCTRASSDVKAPSAGAVPTLPSASSALSAVGASICPCRAWAGLTLPTYRARRPFRRRVRRAHAGRVARRNADRVGRAHPTLPVLRAPLHPLRPLR